MTPISQVSQANTTTSDPQLRVLAEKMESQFLAVMLKSAGLGEPRQTFGGGAGESQFSSFLTAEYADATVKAGGIGFSEAIYNALVRAKEDR